jgi:uncharacterized protein YrzB (UPF0473 family)
MIMLEEEFDGTLFTLTDEEGNEHEFELLDSMEYGDEVYVALVPVYEKPEELVENDGELVILQMVEDEEGEGFIQIEDEDTFNKVAAEFEKRLSDEYEITE